MVFWELTGRAEELYLQRILWLPSWNTKWHHPHSFYINTININADWTAQNKHRTHIAWARISRELNWCFYSMTRGRWGLRSCSHLEKKLPPTDWGCWLNQVACLMLHSNFHCTPTPATKGHLYTWVFKPLSPCCFCPCLHLPLPVRTLSLPKVSCA